MLFRSVLTEQKDRDYKFQIMTPDIGEPYVVESLAISAGTKNYDTCVAFLNWLGSSDVQLDWSNNYGTIYPLNFSSARINDLILPFTVNARNGYSFVIYL